MIFLLFLFLYRQNSGTKKAFPPAFRREGYRV